jgi:TrmH family RNA methyltransferase
MPNPPPGAPTDRPNVPPPPTALTNACVVLVRTQGPVNLGMVSRLCGNLGVTDLRIVAPECEVNCSESRKFSTHSKELLLNAPIYATVEEATADCGLVIGTSGDFRMAEMGPYVRAERVPELLAKKPVAKFALVFGNEAQGLNDAELRACQAWIHLDTFGHNISYNLSNAVAITLYVIATATAPVVEEELPQAAPRSMVESLMSYWFATLERFSYFRRTDPERFWPLFRKFISRQHLSVHDVQILRGMLAQFNLGGFGERFDQKELEKPGKPMELPPGSKGAAVLDARRQGKPPAEGVAGEEASDG